MNYSSNYGLNYSAYENSDRAYYLLCIFSSKKNAKEILRVVLVGNFLIP